VLYFRIEDQAPHAISCHALLLCPCQQGLEQFRCKIQCCYFDCRLAPLSACNATVVAEFSRLSGRLLLLPLGAAGVAAALAAAGVNGRRPLEMFFPFDPYLLRRSARFLDLEVSTCRSLYSMICCNWLPPAGDDSPPFDPYLLRRCTCFLDLEVVISKDKHNLYALQHARFSAAPDTRHAVSRLAA